MNEKHILCVECVRYGQFTIHHVRMYVLFNPVLIEYDDPLPIFPHDTRVHTYRRDLESIVGAPMINIMAKTRDK